MTEIIDARGDLAGSWDVVIVGGGNAALVSALSAHDHGARVLLLERAPKAMRGGNSRHTRNIRCVHDSGDEFNSGPYLFDELWNDLCGVGTGPSDAELAEFTVRESASVPGWMSAHGARWQRPLHGTLHLGRTNRFFLGGGKALVNTYYRALARRGITVRYETTVTDFQIDGDRCTGLVVEADGLRQRVSARTVICAAGGFEANLAWLQQYWGEAANNYHIRGTEFNDGIVLRRLLDSGARTAGQERGFHAVAVDARSPRFDGGIATRLDSIPFGVVLNRDGRRFYDEGEDIWPKRYAIWGRNIAEQPDQIAYCCWDDKVDELFLPPMYGSYRADTIEDLAAKMGLYPVTATATIDEYNRAAPAEGTFDPTRPDGLATTGLTVSKSNWAQRLDTPPFRGVVARPGITFTYLGVAVDRSARVQRIGQSPFANVFAAGEIMSGNILSSGYLAGFGMTIGTVWGRVAGQEAARHALG
ncbi:FAD-dependent tricarballylate dehydrogenase TcuA [Nocardia alni]|uniref:FAD-dependent tricarballylate dehydrogenase TcuA n=1 Tax=Nocardia alni TaxID=2815723 RepID=UPI0027E1EA94|nr:FAD-dependent tricarballylate dehydrogenase TcuA [Nocardia alni]